MGEETFTYFLSQLVRCREEMLKIPIGYMKIKFLEDISVFRSKESFLRINWNAYHKVILCKVVLCKISITGRIWKTSHKTLCGV